jgi:Flp pilus assembly protein TadG
VSELRKLGGREDGAAAVEFALIAGVLSLLIFGMLEFGVAFWQVQNLRSAAREGARVAAVRGDDDDIRDRLESASVGSFTGSAAFTVSPGHCDRDRTGESVTVRITNSSLSDPVQSAFQIQIPFMPAFSVDPDLSGTFRCE